MGGRADDGQPGAGRRRLAAALHPGPGPPGRTGVAGGDRSRAPDRLVPDADPRRLGGRRPADVHRPAGAGLEFTGKVLAYQPPSVLEFSWGPDVLRLEIEARGAGCTLTLLDTFDELGKAARDAAGGHVCLELLTAHLDGDGAGPGLGRRWSEVHADYVTAFGPGGGPPSARRPATARTISASPRRARSAGVAPSGATT